MRLSGPGRKYDDVCCAQFGLGRGARCFHTGTRSIPRQWGCDRRATKPQAKFGGTLRAAVLFGPGGVARSLQIHGRDMRWCPCGSTSRLAWAENSSPQTSPDLRPGPLSRRKVRGRVRAANPVLDLRQSLLFCRWPHAPRPLRSRRALPVGSRAARRRARNQSRCHWDRSRHAL